MFVSSIASHFCFSITLYQLCDYGFENILSTKTYFLDHSANYDNKIRVSETIEKGGFINAEVQPEVRLKFCMYEAAYTVSALKKSNVYDDAVFFTENSRLRKSIYRDIWQKKDFAILGFGDKSFKVNRSVTKKTLRQASETTYVERA